MNTTGLTKLMAAVAALSLALAAPALAADESARAKELINSLGCRGCHQLGGSGGNLGPALDGIGKRMNEKSIRDQLLNPKGKNPQTMMPAYGHLPEKDLKALVDFLKGLK